MATSALNIALQLLQLLLFMLQLGIYQPAKTKSSDSYMDAYGPIYSNGLPQETGQDIEGQREIEGDYMEGVESYEETVKDILQAEDVKAPRQQTNITGREGESEHIEDNFLMMFEEGADRDRMVQVSHIFSRDKL